MALHEKKAHAASHISLWLLFNEAEKKENFEEKAQLQLLFGLAFAEKLSLNTRLLCPSFVAFSCLPYPSSHPSIRSEKREGSDWPCPSILIMCLVVVLVWVGSLSSKLFSCACLKLQKGLVAGGWPGCWLASSKKRRRRHLMQKRKKEIICGVRGNLPAT